MCASSEWKTQYFTERLSLISQSHIGDTSVWSSIAKNKVLVDTKLNVSQQCVILAKRVSWTVSGELLPAGPERWSLPSPQHWWDISGVLWPLVDSSWREDMNMLEKVQQRVTDIVKGLEHVTYTGSLRKLALPCMNKSRFKGTLLMWISIEKGKVQRRQSQHLFRTGPRGNGYTLKHGQSLWISWNFYYEGD